MAAVAARVGVTPMALYRHVADKAALLDGLVEHLLGQLPPHDPALGWADQLDAAAAALRDVAQRHPATFPLLLSRPATASAVAVRDGVRELLIRAGVAPEHVPRVERLVTTLVLGLAVGEATGRFRALTAEELDEDYRALRPFVTAAITPFLAPAPPGPGS
jgi:AcrR family transcriptional regulator